MSGSWFAAAMLVVLSGITARVLLATPPQPEPTPTTRAVVDARGRTVGIPLPFRGSVIYAGVVMPNYLLVTRQASSILNFPALARRGGLQSQLIAKVFPEYANKKGGLAFNNGNGDVEQMLSAQPSVIFTWVDTAAQFEAVGLPAIGVRNTQRESEIFDCVRMYAQTLGQPRRAGELIRYAQSQEAELANELGAVPETQQPRVLALYLTAEGRVSASYGAQHVVTLFWKRGGARNAVAAAVASVRLDPERVMRLDPDVIVLEGPSAPTPAQFESDPRWSALRAVHSRRVYRQPPGLDGFMWNIIDNPLLSRWFAELLHPERVAPTLRARMRAAYRDELGYSASDADLDGALALADNAPSAGYARFASVSP